MVVLRIVFPLPGRTYDLPLLEIKIVYRLVCIGLLVKAGLAEVYRGKHARYFNPRIYQEAEAEAKKAKRNMWSLGDKYISPREWRIRLKKGTL